LASPALTGTPTAPTAAATVNSTQIATTAFVKSLVPYAAAGYTGYYETGWGDTTSNNTSVTANRMYFTVALIPSPITITSLSMRVVNAAASVTIRLGIYDWAGNLITGSPTGTLNSTTTGIKTISGLSISVAPGLYFFGVVAQGGTPGFAGYSGQNPYLPQTALNTATTFGVYTTVSGAVPSTLGTVTDSAFAPRIIYGV
jgi:hypothetical protein